MWNTKDILGNVPHYGTQWVWVLLGDYLEISSLQKRGIQLWNDTGRTPTFRVKFFLSAYFLGLCHNWTMFLSGSLGGQDVSCGRGLTPEVWPAYMREWPRGGAKRTHGRNIITFSKQTLRSIIICWRRCTRSRFYFFICVSLLRSFIFVTMNSLTFYVQEKGTGNSSLLAETRAALTRLNQQANQLAFDSVFLQIKHQLCRLTKPEVRAQCFTNFTLELGQHWGSTLRHLCLTLHLTFQGSRLCWFERNTSWWSAGLQFVTTRVHR